MAYPLPQQILKNNDHLSSMTKGFGEFFDEEKRVDIVLDPNVSFISFLFSYLLSNQRKKDQSFLF